jgi:hypothetical protein
MRALYTGIFACLDPVSVRQELAPDGIVFQESKVLVAIDEKGVFVVVVVVVVCSRFEAIAARHQFQCVPDNCFDRAANNLSGGVTVESSVDRGSFLVICQPFPGTSVVDDYSMEERGIQIRGIVEI